MASPSMREGLNMKEGTKEVTKDMKTRMNNPDFLRMILGILAVLLVLAIGSAAYFYQQLANLKNNPQKIAQEEATDLVNRLGKLIVLPEGEQPTVATVNDLGPLKSQPFFAKAKLGDKVFIFTQSKKAILYDPISNKIVEIAPLNIGNPGQ